MWMYTLKKPMYSPIAWSHILTCVRNSCQVRTMCVLCTKCSLLPTPTDSCVSPSSSATLCAVAMASKRTCFTNMEAEIVDYIDGLLFVSTCISAEHTRMQRILTDIRYGQTVEWKSEKGLVRSIHAMRLRHCSISRLCSSASNSFGHILETRWIVLPDGKSFRMFSCADRAPHNRMPAGSEAIRRSGHNFYCFDTQPQM